MKKNFSILIYEKERILNSILHYQISNHNNYVVDVIDDGFKLIDIVIKKNFDTFIINLDDFKQDFKILMESFQKKNKHCNIIGYFNNNLDYLETNENKIFLLKKPFKIITLLNQLDNIKILNNLDNSNKYLMDHLIFSPSKKIISNIKVKHTEHLTEKENNLLIYFYNNKNIEIPKKDLLTNIWGVSNEINTHTLETHIYRLKQKLSKLDQNLSFSLTNKNGLYCLKYNV